MPQKLGPFPRIKKALYLCTPLKTWRGVRVVEGARLESVYRPKAYRGFESLSLRQSIQKLAERLAFLFCNRSFNSWHNQALPAPTSGSGPKVGCSKSFWGVARWKGRAFCSGEFLDCFCHMNRFYWKDGLGNKLYMWSVSTSSPNW